MKINLLEQDIWKNDSVTRRYKKEYGEILNAPSKMNVKELANACTYCNNWNNPYAREIVKRAGMYDWYDSTRDLKHKREIIEKACTKYGIRLL